MRVRFLVILLLAALLGGCADQGVSSGAQPSDAATEQVEITAPAAPDSAEGDTHAAALTQAEGETDTGAEKAEGVTSACLASAPTVPADARKVLVKRAVDGDTLELVDGTRVRLTGINTPESVDPRRPVEYLGKEASAFTASLVEGQEVFIQPSRTPVDRYGRTLAWVWLADGMFLNAKLVYEGFAQTYTFPDNPDYADLFLQCEREAREAGRGLWASNSEGEEVVEAPAPKETTGDRAAAVDAEANSLVIVAEPGTVTRGSTASITVQTAAGRQCDIVVQYKSGPSKAKGLEPKTTGTDGRVTWSWTVGRNTTPGSWPVTVTCGPESVQTTVHVQ